MRTMRSSFPIVHFVLDVIPTLSPSVALGTRGRTNSTHDVGLSKDYGMNSVEMWPDGERRRNRRRNSNQRQTRFHPKGMTTELFRIVRQRGDVFFSFERIRSSSVAPLWRLILESNKFKLSPLAESDVYNDS